VSGATRNPLTFPRASQRSRTQARPCRRSWWSGGSRRRLPRSSRRSRWRRSRHPAIEQRAAQRRCSKGPDRHRHATLTVHGRDFRRRESQW
jgi:hypothetical protein